MNNDPNRLDAVTLSLLVGFNHLHPALSLKGERESFGLRCPIASQCNGERRRDKRAFCIGMRLPAGEYFGTTGRKVDAEGLRFSATRYPPMQEEPWHTHEQPTLFVHLAGQIIDGCEAAEWQLGALEVTYHPVSTPHRCRIGPRGAAGINLEVSEKWLNEQADLSAAALGGHRVVSSSRSRTAALRVLGLYLTSPPHELSDLALELLEPFAMPDCQGAEFPKWLHKVEEEMKARFMEPIGLASLARSAGVHSMHLARVFRRRHGCSVTEHLQRLRLLAAADRILQGEPMGIAALEAGFSDQFHFSRVLKAHFGYSPTAFKRLAAGRPCC
jgi:AraC family transcriptional regulator